MKPKIIFFICFSLFFSSCIEEPVNPQNDNKGNFEALWEIIDTKYCYLDYKNINWDSVRAEYSKRVEPTMTELDFFQLMGDMLAELKDGHVNLYSDFDRSRYWNWGPTNFNSAVLFSERYLGDRYMIAGGMRYQKIANDSIGYIYYNDFSTRFSDTNMRYIFNYFSKCKGIIIDVRENGGGYLDLSEKLASYFFSENTIVGYMQHKIGSGHSDFSKPVEIITPAHETLQWQKSVVIIANRRSYSATNSFISRMKIAPYATIIGDTSGGGGGLPMSSEMPNGWMVRFSSSPMYDVDMQNIEWGVDPDIKVDLKQQDLDAGLETIIEKGIQILTIK
jgi:hypothetical protein